MRGLAAAAHRGRARRRATSRGRSTPARRATSSRSSGSSPAPDDLIVIRYSAWSPALGRLLDAARSASCSSTTTSRPPGTSGTTAPGWRSQCAVGRMQLPAFARAARRGDRRLAASTPTSCAARRATGVRVVPVLFDPARLAERGGAPGGRGPAGARDRAPGAQQAPRPRLPRLRGLPARVRARRPAAVRGHRRSTRATPSSCARWPPSPGARNITLAGGLSQERRERGLRGRRRAAHPLRARGLLRAAARGVSLRRAGGGAPARARCPRWRATPCSTPTATRR